MAGERNESGPASAFSNGFKSAIGELVAEVAELYLSDSIPWVVGYSGGKDSTATLQLVWMALATLPPAQLTKPVHVISTDTMVENPVVAAWVARSLRHMGDAAQTAGLPITPHRLTPKIEETFWVSLIGKGYPAPRPKFRWCTERMKINPSNKFILDVAQANGEAIVVLGMRKTESIARGRVMGRLEEQRARDKLSPNASLANSLVYTPIETWTNDDVWTFLMQVKNPWGFRNKDLLTMYQGASADGECPLVIDSSTPSCGDSRFGCWTCTLVEKDRSMQAMIQNDSEKEWMLPLLRLRDDLDGDDRHLRDFRRMNGSLQLHRDRLIHGPYLQSAREGWLRKLLEAQQEARSKAPADMKELELISVAEMNEIRRIWVVDKHEVEDSLPDIYEEVTGEPFPGPALDDGLRLGAAEMRILREICAGDDLHFELTRELLDVVRQQRTVARRSNLYKSIESALRRGSHDSPEAAEALALSRQGALESARGPAMLLPLEAGDGGA